MRLAATLTLTLPGTAFVYQGDEIGLHDGPGADPPYDRRGRDFARHAMQWTPARSAASRPGRRGSRRSTPSERNVADQRGDPGSLLNLYRELIRLRRDMPLEFELLGVEDGVLVVPPRRLYGRAELHRRERGRTCTAGRWSS